MKILYLSVHEILEYDELLLFTELGHECYSMGAYTHPYGDQGRKRPGIPGMPYEPHFTELATRYSKDDLHPEMIEPMDVIIVMHEPSFIEKNWDKIKHKRVIWRSIGQSVDNIEGRLERYRREGLEIVRYSPAESYIPGYLGADAVIRFYKDPDEYQGWTGERAEIMTLSQSMKFRGEFCHYDIFHEACKGFPATLYGPGNEEEPENGGLLSYEDMKQAMRDYRVFFYTGTHPASYTLSFIEAMMTGTPIVSVGHRHGNSSIFQQRTFEIPEIIRNTNNGFVSDNLEDLRSYLKQLLTDYDMAKAISQNARRTAIELFGKKAIKEQWRVYLAKEG